MPRPLCIRPPQPLESLMLPRQGPPQERHQQAPGVERDRRFHTLTGSLAGVRGKANKSALVERPPPPTTWLCFRKRAVNEPTP